MRACSESALQLAQWLESQPAVERVYYPGLPSHPQHELAKRQQSAFGGIVSFRAARRAGSRLGVIDAHPADLDYRQSG
jgi:O-succinylhomoserine sulfhydrylase